MDKIKGEFLIGFKPEDPSVNLVWEKIFEKLSNFDEPLSEDQIAYLYVYFVEGTYVASGDIDTAREIYENTKKLVGDKYTNFEDTHPGLFAAIDITLRRVSNWGVEPAFKISE